MSNPPPSSGAVAGGQTGAGFTPQPTTTPGPATATTTAANATTSSSSAAPANNQQNLNQIVSLLLFHGSFRAFHRATGLVSNVLSVSHTNLCPSGYNRCPCRVGGWRLLPFIYCQAMQRQPPPRALVSHYFASYMTCPHKKRMDNRPVQSPYGTGSPLYQMPDAQRLPRPLINDPLTFHRTAGFQPHPHMVLHSSIHPASHPASPPRIIIWPSQTWGPVLKPKTPGHHPYPAFVSNSTSVWPLAWPTPAVRRHGSLVALSRRFATTNTSPDGPS